MNPIFCFENGKKDRTTSGKCIKIVHLKESRAPCCLLIVQNPKCLMTFTMDEIQENPSQLKICTNQKALKATVTDAIQLSFKGQFIIVLSTAEGKLVQCQVEKDKHILNELCQLSSKSAITTIGFLDCGNQFNLFLLDAQGDLWRVEGEQLSPFKKEQKMSLFLKNITLMQTASDFSSVLVLDQEGEIHLLLPSSQSKQSFIQLSFIMNESYNSLLKSRGSSSLPPIPILDSVVAFDYKIKNQKLKVYATNNTDLIAIECTINKEQVQSTFEVAQILGIDQTKGVVNQLFAYGNGGRPSFPYEIALVQEKCVRAINITDELSQLLLWQTDSESRNPQLAYLYQFACFGTINRHLLHYIPLASEKLKQSSQKEIAEFKYDGANSKISAFYF